MISQIGRLSEEPSDYDYRFTHLSVPTNQIQAAQGNPYRVYLGFMATGGTIFLGPTGQTTVVNAGPYVINSNTTLFEFFWDRHRGIVTLPWFTVASAAGNFLNVSEIVMVPRG